MVHALKSAWRVLQPGGLVVDIRSTSDPALVLCETPAGRVVVGRLRGTRRKTRAATVRLKRVVREGFFRLSRTKRFRFWHYASSLTMLRAYLGREWADARIDAETARRIRRLLGPKAVGALIIDEPARINVLVKDRGRKI